MSIFQPLNSMLYNRLRVLFGDVKIAKPGQGWSSERYSDGGRAATREITTGEYYVVACPYCKYNGTPDTRKRLWINHNWGVPDAYGNSRWYTAICYRNGCLANPLYRNDLRTRIYQDYDLGRRKAITVRQGAVQRTLTSVVEWPGQCMELKDLPAEHPSHLYLRERFYDPAYIGDRYGVRYCMSPNQGYFPAANRLIMPIYMNGKMVTWQARYCGDVDWKRSGIPKYYNQADSNKSACLYDYDNAKHSSFVTLVESVTSCWRLGTGAVALLGKTLSDFQMHLIKSTWKGVVIALDPDAYYNSEEAFSRLRKHMPNVVRVILPDKCDPADLPEAHFWDLVLQSAAERGVNLLSL